MQIAVKAFNKSAGGICHKNLPGLNGIALSTLSLSSAIMLNTIKSVMEDVRYRSTVNLGVLNGRTVKIMT